MQMIPKIIPINELKNTGNISKLCSEHNDAIIITKNGYADMAIMNVNVYEEKMAKLEAALRLNEALNSNTRKENKSELNKFIEELINE